MVDLGYRRTGIWRYGKVVGMFEECPFGRHGPRRPGRANIRQSLLDADRPVRTLHDKYVIEVSIAHFADLPIFRPVAEQCPHVFELSHQREQALRIEYPVGREFLFMCHDQLPSVIGLGISPPPKTRPESVASWLP